MRRSSFLSAVLTFLFGFALLAVPFASAQDTVPPTAGISVIGYGEASAPAEMATVQITITDGNFSGPPIAQPGATPGARERESVAGAVAALVEAGIAEEDIEVFVGPSVTFNSQAQAILQFPVDAPDNARINELVDASTVAAADESLVVGQVNARFGIEDCDGLISQAREAAISDAREQAEVQADLLGVTIGDVTGSADLPTTEETDFGYYGPFLLGSTCNPDIASGQGTGLFGAPVYDPSREPEVTARSRIALTFGLENATDATPA